MDLIGRSLFTRALRALAAAGCLLVAVVGASAAHTSSVHAAKAPTVALRKTGLGTILVAGASGHTLYLYTHDTKNKSKCTGECASIWPPLMVTGKPVAGKGVSASKLGEIKRGNGHQVTYAGHPLYLFSSDTKAGQTTGENSGGFMVVTAAGNAK